MKQLNIHILFFAIVLGFLFNSCKKYPEDERRYWLSRPEARMPGACFINQFLINDHDSTLSPTYMYARNMNYEFTYTKKNGGNLKGHLCRADWEFDQKKNNIKFINFRWNPPLNYATILPIGDSMWEIRKLTKKELKLRSYINGNKYEITFYRV